MVRIVAAIVTVLCGLLLAWVIYVSVQPEDVVVPTGGVTGGQRDAVPASPPAEQALRERTRLQRWRAATGPSPASPAPSAVEGQPISSEPVAQPPRELVERWWSREETYWDLLRDRGFVAGVVNIPDSQAAVLMQPQGREWRRLHNEEITFGGGYVIFGVALLLAVFLALRGRIGVAKGFSGKRVPRFDGFERANHWVTATSFILMALSGLILLYGQFGLKPWMGAAAYSTLAEASAFAHIAFAVPFVIGVLIMVVLWVRQNWLTGVDLHWLARGGGFLSEKSENPPAPRFNAGQKLIFWGVVLGMLLLLASGLTLVLPFFWLGIAGMQWAQLAHAALGLLMIGLIIAHIYIGTVGMQGAFDAMWSGDVDRNWAEEHHSIWFERLKREGRI